MAALCAVPVLFACSTEVMVEKEEKSLQTREYSLKIHLAGHPFTRTEEMQPVDEEGIEKLTAVFLNKSAGEPSVERIVEARRITGEAEVYYVLGYTTEAGNFPDYLTAIANYDGDPGSDILNVKTDRLLKETADGVVMTMTSARYFNEIKDDIYFSTLNAENFINSTPVDVFLERTAAKVTLTKKQTFKNETPVFYHNGRKVSPQLHLTGWAVNATDKESYLIKHIQSTSDYNSKFVALEAELTEPTVADEWEWNTSRQDVKENIYPTLHWSHSAGYEINTFPSTGKERNEKDEIVMLTFNDIVNPFMESSSDTPVYVNETTRKSDVFDTPNALPSIVIAGYYTLEGESDATTFYRRGEELLTEEEYWVRMTALQDALYLEEGRLSVEQFKEIMTDCRPVDAIMENETEIPFNHICPQLKNDIVPSLPLFDKDGEVITLNEETKMEINRRLFETCGSWEKFIDGCCFFSIPIKHERPSQGTGFYGIVRNHHYDITLNSISGLGSGVAEKDKTVGDAGSSPIIPPYEVELIFNLLPWTEMDGGNVDLVEKNP